MTMVDLRARKTFLKRFAENRAKIERLETKLKEKGSLTPLEKERLEKYKVLDREMCMFY